MAAGWWAAAARFCPRPREGLCWLAMRGFLFTLISMVLVGGAAAAGTVYKWVDENGVVHYSDQPHPDAQKVKVPDAQTYKALPVGGANGAPAPASVPYQGCAVVQPASDANLANIESVTVVVQTDPPLRPGDQVFVTFDGQPLNGRSATGPTYTISPVERGAHTLQAVVRDSTGAVLCQTPGVTFNVQQNSVLNPNNPNNRVPKPH
jgi:hypothetical protein